MRDDLELPLPLSVKRNEPFHSHHVEPEIFAQKYRVLWRNSIYRFNRNRIASLVPPLFVREYRTDCLCPAMICVVCGAYSFTAIQNVCVLNNTIDRLALRLAFGHPRLHHFVMFRQNFSVNRTFWHFVVVEHEAVYRTNAIRLLLGSGHDL